MAEAFRQRVAAAELSARQDPNNPSALAAVLDPSDAAAFGSLSSVDFAAAEGGQPEQFNF